MECRFCKKPVSHVFIDLINAPASNSFLTEEQLNEPEVFFPLKIYTCDNCFLVQVDEYKKSDAIFDSQYVYFSSYSTSWLAHAKKYTELMTERFGLNAGSQVIEVASNDGYLLQYFLEKKIPVLGIEPTANTAAAAEKKGVRSIVDFFGVSLAEKLAGEGTKADLLLGNNVLAHVPDINDFVGGMKVILKENGVVTMEFPHLIQLIKNNQFDTIYHEHFSYLSLYTVSKVFDHAGLRIFDVDEIPTHGGSLRIYATHKENTSHATTDRVSRLMESELREGVNDLAYYSNFTEKVLKVKLDVLEFLVTQKRNGRSVAAYGAAAKGNTLLNYCGVKSDFIQFVVDANPAKQNKFLPASHIPVVNEEHLRTMKPEFVMILPWNLKEEIVAQLSYIKEWGGKFVVPIPELKVL